MADFKTRLKPWAERWSDLNQDIATWVRESTDDELTQIERDAFAPNSTNCWYATLEVAQQIKQAIASERLRRKRAEPRNTPGLSADGARRE